MMHLDNLVSYFSAGEGNQLLCEADLVKSRWHDRNGSNHAYILFPPWGQKLIWYTPLRRHILGLGCSCLEYEFSKAILTADYQLMRRYTRWAIISIKKDFNRLEKLGFRELTVIGTSAGSMFSLLVANGDQRVKKLILNTVGNCQAELIWASQRLKMLKNKMEQNGLTLDKLKQYWRDISPENNLSGLHDKRIFINLSRADRVVPYRNGRKLVDKMRLAGLNPTVAENDNLGHYLTAVKYYLKPNFL